MRGVTVNKLAREENTDAEMLAEGIVAFQIVQFIIDFFGTEVFSELDTKIMADGRQIVIDGDGFIPSGYKVVA